MNIRTVEHILELLQKPTTMKELKKETELKEIYIDAVLDVLIHFDKIKWERSKEYPRALYYSLK